nr:hypothetical protein [Tanacetum cinerariifolium]
MLQELKAMYSKQAEQELLQTVREFHTSKQEEGQPVSTHVLKIKGYIDNLERVGQPVGQNFAKNKPPKAAKGSHGKGKGKMGYASNNAPFAPKPKTPPPPNKGNPARTPFSTNMVTLGTGEGTSVREKESNTARHGLIYDESNYSTKVLLDYALETAARILTMVPTKKVEKTPYEIWNGQAPKMSYLKVWGCEAFVKRDTLTKPDKLDPRSFKCIFVGYPKKTMRYSFYNPSENKVFVARNAEFFESKLLDLKAKDDQEIEKPQSDINPIRKSSMTHHAPDHMCLYIDAEEHVFRDLGEPANYKDALLDPESKKWLDAMNVEMQSLKDNDVWVLVELPPNARTVGDAAYILGIKIYHDRSKQLIGLCQKAYIKKILKIYYMENSKRGTIPMQEKLKLSKSQDASTPAKKQRMQNIPYASVVGSIMYDVRCTRPDVCVRTEHDKPFSIESG